MRKEPDVSIDVYLKKPLDFSLLGQLYPLEKREPNKKEPIPDVVVYEWRPLRTCFPRIVVSSSTQPRYHSVHVDDGLLEQFIEDASSEGLQISPLFIRKLREEGLVADRTTHALLQKYPDIRQILSDHKSFCNILEFTQGEPTYQAFVESYAEASQKFRAIHFALDLINNLCNWYNGIACDETHDKAGKPLPFLLARSGGHMARVEGEYSLQWRTSPAAK